MPKQHEGNIYLITDGEFFKIGRTKHSAQKRLKELQTGNPLELRLLCEIPVFNPSKVESTLHRRFSYCKEHNEWFCLTQKDVSSFEALCKQTDNNFEVLKEFENKWI